MGNQIPAKGGDIDDEKLFRGGHKGDLQKGGQEKHENGDWPAIAADSKILAKKWLRRERSISPRRHEGSKGFFELFRPIAWMQ
jgi:hypothetical protein